MVIRWPPVGRDTGDPAEDDDGFGEPAVGTVADGEVPAVVVTAARVEGVGEAADVPAAGVPEEADPGGFWAGVVDPAELCCAADSDV
jgi:hypothetical protein